MLNCGEFLLPTAYISGVDDACFAANKYTRFECTQMAKKNWPIKLNYGTNQTQFLGTISRH
jgi:hypothetical protein